MDELRLEFFGLSLPRKSFEFGSSALLNKSVEEQFAQIMKFNSHLEGFGEHLELEKYWAREHAFYTVGRDRGKLYSDLLPGRLYTYTLVRNLISALPGLSERSIIELGCGSALCLHLLSGLGFRCVAFDIAVSALQFSKSIGNEFDSNIQYTVGDYFSKMRVESDEFEVVYNLGALEHWRKAKQCELLLKMANIASKYVVLIVPNTESPIFLTMEEREFAVMPASNVYPEEHEWYEVDFGDLAARTGLPVISEGALHLAPPESIPLKHLDAGSKSFFQAARASVSNRAGSLFSRWFEFEKTCSDLEQAKYGWFKYCVFEAPGT